jgi:glycosyltransferase involved in cell wall biosynthesis
MSETLSVVMPVRDEALHLPATIEALVAALGRSGFEADLVLVDDGSMDGSADVARRAVAERLPLRIVSQPNRGRFEARRAGLEAATGDLVLLLDGRVRVRPGALAFVQAATEDGRRVWTSHVEVDAAGNPYGTFWKLLAELAWADYFERPRTTCFGAGDFDRYPKGTTCFLAPRERLLEAVASFRSRYADARHANDDTPLIRWLAEREPVHVSPDFAVDYRPRTTLGPFVRHSFHRGLVFLDGHGRRESRFFPAVVAFYPLSTLLALASLRRRAALPATAFVVALAAAGLGIARRRTVFETLSLAVLAPVYAAAHGAGMWKGLGLLAAGRRRRARR